MKDALKLVIEEAIEGRNYYTQERYHDEAGVAALRAALAALGVETAMRSDQIEATQWPEAGHAQAQAQALEDAARYRWLRERMPYHILCDFPAAADGSKPGLPFGKANWPAGVDAAVDVARKREA